VTIHSFVFWYIYLDILLFHSKFHLFRLPS
jgi:hypothetical protein